MLVLVLVVISFSCKETIVKKKKRVSVHDEPVCIHSNLKVISVARSRKAGGLFDTIQTE